MNREILFKGKIKETNDWIYGNLVTELSTGRTFICDLDYFTEDTKLSDVLLEVIPETICEYTGKNDNNGKKIFENDIIEEGCNGFISSVIYDNDIGTYKLKDLGNYYIKDASIEWEVIGNIFDEENKCSHYQ